jgi:hypothetical protein
LVTARTLNEVDEILNTILEAYTEVVA